jgi:hypothetical protein
MVHLQSGSTVLLWDDMWNNKARRINSAELISFTTISRITVRQAYDMDQIHDMFQLPMSEIFWQYILLCSELEILQITDENDILLYIWVNAQFSVSKTLALAIHSPTHPIFIRLWSSKYQPKHRVYFWLLLRDKLNTRDQLRRGHMELDSYTCENCILQTQKAIYHLFI